MKHLVGKTKKISGACVAFGSFDGIHAGHRSVIEKLIKTATIKNLVPVLVSFDADDGKNLILTTESEKVFLLQAFPIEYVISIPVPLTDNLFIKEVLLELLSAKAIVIGKNHDALSLYKSAGNKYGFDVVECETVEDDEAPVCSARVSEALDIHKMDNVTDLLNHPYIVSGRVMHGKQLGRTVGLPTANIDIPRNKRLPPDGSYVTVTTVDGMRKVGLTNIGKRPTVDNLNHTTIETHILDYFGDLYGTELVIEFHRFIREVSTFDNLKALREQIERDILSLGDYIEEIKNSYSK